MSKGSYRETFESSLLNSNIPKRALYLAFKLLTIPLSQGCSLLTTCVRWQEFKRNMTQQNQFVGGTIVKDEQDFASFWPDSLVKSREPSFLYSSSHSPL